MKIKKMMEYDKDQISGMKILVVDDVLDNLAILGHFLQQIGLEISVARSGEKAFELVAQNNPDLILLDIRMPGIDGYEVCRRLKEDVSTKDIPIIFYNRVGRNRRYDARVQCGGC